MTTLQPRLVRADTLDLQSHNAPSAQDHTRSPTFASYAHGAAGTHHREALRSAEESSYNDRKLSPRMSAENTSSGSATQVHQYDSTDDDGDDEQQDDANEEPNEGDYEDGNDENDDDLEDDLLDKISSSPSIEDEDIDFEFVYALHTFVATVEGQANATKGDTMVLLDDSNSYWWLVRVVKDGSIGYLPAEHIETPTERLARLNKHRNIDLSASMLGDNPEKSKNPLKKAMRRRNAKTVAFTAPTYYEPSEYEYDTEDEDEEDVERITDGAQANTTQQSEVNTAQQSQQVSGNLDNNGIVNGIGKVGNDDQALVHSPISPVTSEASDALATHNQPEENIQRSRNGTVRNTDSFFKDDTAETKKISLTPRLLRNDADPQASAEQDLRSKASSDTFDKMLGPDDKSKEKEKEKEKEKKKEKKGMLSGLFKRKDKSAKGGKNEVEEDKADEIIRPSQTKDPLEPVSGLQSPAKKAGKLQKSQQITTVSPTNAVIDAKGTPQAQPVAPTESSLKPANIVTLSGDVRETQQEHQSGRHEEGLSESTTTKHAPALEKRSLFSPITTVLKSSPTHSGDHDTTKPVYSKRAKERFAIDASDSEDDYTPAKPQTAQDRTISPMHNTHAQDSRPDSAMAVSPVETSDTDTDDRPLQSTIHSTDATPEHHQGSSRNVHGTPQSDTASTSKPSPSLATHTPSTSRSTPTWSDASLRSYMENDQDIRDLLIIVHDKSNVTPVGPDHPLMGGLFMTERTRLAEMQTQLDSMLTTWISKKNPGLLAR